MRATEVIAVRISATLEWLSLPVQVHAFMAHYSRPQGVARTRNLKRYWDLVKALFTLLHELVIGHVLNPKLNLSKLSLVALNPVIAFWSQASSPRVPATSQFRIAQLGRALLQQLALDRATLGKRCEQAESEQREASRELGTVSALFELLRKLNRSLH